jgi:hypothetical protein
LIVTLAAVVTTSTASGAPVRQQREARDRREHNAQRIKVAGSVASTGKQRNRQAERDQRDDRVARERRLRAAAGRNRARGCGHLRHEGKRGARARSHSRGGSASTPELAQERYSTRALFGGRVIAIAAG